MKVDILRKCGLERTEPLPQHLGLIDIERRAKFPQEGFGLQSAETEFVMDHLHS